MCEKITRQKIWKDKNSFCIKANTMSQNCFWFRTCFLAKKLCALACRIRIHFWRIPLRIQAETIGTRFARPAFGLLKNLRKNRWVPYWCPREESNLDQRLRSPLFYPLNYKGNNNRLAHLNNLENCALVRLYRLRLRVSRYLSVLVLLLIRGGFSFLAIGLYQSILLTLLLQW